MPGCTDTDTVTIDLPKDWDFSLDTITADSFTITDTTCDVDLTMMSDILTVSTIDTLLSKPSLSIGDVELQEEDLKKLKALVDLLEGLDDENELKQMFNTQKSLNEIGK